MCREAASGAVSGKSLARGSEWASEAVVDVELVELRGFEPLASCMPLTRGRLARPFGAPLRFRAPQGTGVVR
jgi:hypothetical protein